MKSCTYAARARAWLEKGLLAVTLIGLCACARRDDAEAGREATAGSKIATPPPTTPSFTTFESGQVRPLALSPDGKLLFAVNTPDNR
ncbi:MAG TPA: hypothetical protein VK932_24890, partial [Kofleriaceae bacterium]|nr:hypothetical protein [Kofleriaceae bacterium]